MNLHHTFGLRPDGAPRPPDRRAATGSILLKLPATASRSPRTPTTTMTSSTSPGNLFARYREQARLLADHCLADRRIQLYLDELIATTNAQNAIRLPGETLILDQYGLARELSLPLDGDRYENELVSSYRLDNGILTTRW